MEFTYGIGERVIVVGGDTDDPIGEIVDMRHHPIPGNPFYGIKEEQVNVKLDGGGETGFIPITLVHLFDKRPITEQTHDPVQGLPRAPGHGPASERLETYIDPAPKNPDALAGVVDELEDLAVWMKRPYRKIGSIKMRELRSKVINAAIMVKGCCAEWQRQQEYERSKSIKYQGEDVPMPGRNSSDFGSIRKELESIAYAVSNKLMPCHADHHKADFEVYERLKNLVNITHRLQELWLADEETIGQLMRMRPDYHVPRHKILFFGPDNGGTELAKDMEREGVLPESKMEDRLNHFAEHGWHTAHVSYNEHFVMKQWRVMMEKP